MWDAGDRRGLSAGRGHRSGGESSVRNPCGRLQDELPRQIDDMQDVLLENVRIKEK